MKKSTLIVFALIVVGFIVSWIIKGNFGDSDSPYQDAFLVTLAAFLTLSIMSFLYKDNPFYKFAEHLFVGVSAAYWMCLGFWSTIVGNLIPRLSRGLSEFFEVPYIESGDLLIAIGNFEIINLPIYIFFYIPIIFGILLLMRLSPKGGWLSRWPLAFIVGTTAGLNFVRYLRSDFIKQIYSTIIPLVVEWHGFGAFFSDLSLSATGQLALMASNIVIFIGVICGLVYFFFSKAHTGLFGGASRVGIWVLMITFGASFGYTVMGRISLLVGRITFLFRDWLEIIN